MGKGNSQTEAVTVPSGKSKTVSELTSLYSFVQENHLRCEAIMIFKGIHEILNKKFKKRPKKIQ